jgi:hypothetical protein
LEGLLVDKAKYSENVGHHLGKENEWGTWSKNQIGDETAHLIHIR